MDYNMENYFRMQQTDGYKMPFYMTYPMQNIYMNEIEYDKDSARMKEMYPEEAKKIQWAVEEECDKMEYDGSLMFDESPDRVMLEKLCNDIYRKVYGDASNDMETEEFRSGRGGRGSSGNQGGRNLIQVLLFDEMFRRRCRHNRCRRWW